MILLALAEFVPGEDAIRSGNWIAISLALLHNDAPVGWVLAQATGADSVRYSNLFVAPDHRGRARGLSLLAHAFRRQHDACIPIARAAIDGRNTAMLRLIKRHLSIHLHAIGSSRISQAPTLQLHEQAQTTPLN